MMVVVAYADITTLAMTHILAHPYFAFQTISGFTNLVPFGGFCFSFGGLLRGQVFLEDDARVGKCYSEIGEELREEEKGVEHFEPSLFES
jgi:hypothetical protein